MELKWKYECKIIKSIDDIDLNAFAHRLLSENFTPPVVIFATKKIYK